MKWITRMFIITTVSLSLTINGLLLITQSGFNFITETLDNMGINTPVSSSIKEQTRLKKSHNDLKRKNAQLNKTNSNLIAKTKQLDNTIKSQKNVITKQKSAIKNYATHINGKVTARAVRIVSTGAAKTAATLVPAAANVVLGGVLLMDALSLVEMCDDMVQFEESIKDFDDTDLLQETNKITGEVCAMKMVEVSESEAKEKFENLKNWSTETKESFLEGIETISDGVKANLPDICSFTSIKIMGCGLPPEL